MPNDPSLRALLTGSIDYAGLFPPTMLPLDQVLKNYARYRAGSEGWMLGRLLCPATRLHQLLLPQHVSLLPEGPPLPLAAILGGGSEPLELWRDRRDAELNVVASFQAAVGGRVELEGVEMRLPEQAVWQANRALLVQLLGETAERLQAAGVATGRIFYEPPPGTRAALVSAFVAVLADHNQRTGDQAALKLRAGGPDSASLVTAELIAELITACRDAQVSWKATAGLHHPLRHWDPALDAWSHGFLNVLAAAVLADVAHLSVPAVQAVLTEQSADRFVFGPDRLQWRDLQATVGQIAAARRRSLIAFGSCSFQQPCDELRTLGLIGETI